MIVIQPVPNQFIFWGDQSGFFHGLKLTDTKENMQLPINCVLMGDQPEQIDRDALVKLYKRIFRE
jgi:hypothetical protein